MLETNLPMLRLLIFLLLASYCSIGQNNFTLRVSGQGLDTVVISPPAGKSSLYNLLNVKFTSGDYLFDIEKKGVFTRINKRVELIGEVPQPHPLAITIVSGDNSGYEGNYFFLEKGDIEIFVKDSLGNVDLVKTSPSNTEYAKLKNGTKVYDDLLQGEDKLDLTVLDAKQIFLKTYIVQNPGSFVALWEIFFDYSKYDFHPAYLENLNLFSEEIQKSDIYVGLVKVLETHKATLIGEEFPEIFLKDFTLNKEYFSQHKLTVIDYWATSCKPCIEGFPKLKSLHEMYLKKGLNLIGVVDENEADRMANAQNILKRKSVTWENYFDAYNEFPKKLSVSGYPTFFMVDSEGKIIQRFIGEGSKLELEIEKILGI